MEFKRSLLKLNVIFALFSLQTNYTKKSFQGVLKPIIITSIFIILILIIIIEYIN